MHEEERRLKELKMSNPDSWWEQARVESRLDRLKEQGRYEDGTYRHTHKGGRKGRRGRGRRGRKSRRR